MLNNAVRLFLQYEIQTNKGKIKFANHRYHLIQQIVKKIDQETNDHFRLLLQNENIQHPLISQMLRHMAFEIPKLVQ